MDAIQCGLISAKCNLFVSMILIYLFFLFGLGMDLILHQVDIQFLLLFVFLGFWLVCRDGKTSSAYDTTAPSGAG